MKRVVAGVVLLAMFGASCAWAQSSTWRRLQRERSARNAQAKVVKDADGGITVPTGCPMGTDSVLRHCFYGGPKGGSGAILKIHVAHRVGDGFAMATYEYHVQTDSVITVCGVKLRVLAADANRIKYELVKE